MLTLSLVHSTSVIRQSIRQQERTGEDLLLSSRRFRRRPSRSAVQSSLSALRLRCLHEMFLRAMLRSSRFHSNRCHGQERTDSATPDPTARHVRSTGRYAAECEEPRPQTPSKGSTEKRTWCFTLRGRDGKIDCEIYEGEGKI